SITDFIPANELEGALANRLLHADTIDMVRILPKMLEHMPPEERERLFKEPIKHINREIWDELAATRPQLLKQGFSPEAPQAYFSKIFTGGVEERVSDAHDDILFNGVSMEAAVTILPMLFEALDKEDRIKTTKVIAEALHEIGED